MFLHQTLHHLHNTDIAAFMQNREYHLVLGAVMKVQHLAFLAAEIAKQAVTFAHL